MSEQYYYKINGMKWGGCVTNVENAVKKVPAIENIEIDLGSAMAVVKASVDLKAIGAAIDGAGFNAILISE